ncbi:MAG: hypothetical protein WBL23_11285 [Salinisphaera sp.]
MQRITVLGRQSKKDDRASCEHDAVQRPYIRNLFHTSPFRRFAATGQAAAGPRFIS